MKHQAIGIVTIKFHSRVTGTVQEKITDNVTLVTEQQYEIVATVRRVVFHDVPENRTISDGRHRFGNDIADFAETGALSAT